jgi:alpha-L-fucosidase
MGRRRPEAMPAAGSDGPAGTAPAAVFFHRGENMKRIVLSFCVLSCLAGFAAAQQASYQPTWASLNTRPTPAWYDQAKFGIFIHWGVYSVPAFADPHGKAGEAYAEWYWNHMHDKDGPTWKFHVLNYGANFHYQDFAPMFKAKLFDPDQWAELFKESGARYVVLTSKHHDGFCLWPCPASWNWNAVDVGPHRDLAGDLAKAVRAHGLRMGFYYSLYEWYDPLYHSDLNRYVDEHMIPQMKDLVERYHPSTLWTDGEWEHPSSAWKSTQFLAWLFNESPVKDQIVIDDRWGSETRGKDGGVYTSEYGKANGKQVEYTSIHKWVETQGMGKSFGYNRMETAADYKTARELIGLLVRTVSEGGNLALDIGPAADGRIPVIMQERLLQMGKWFKVNGDAIYGTRPWRAASDGQSVRYTSKDNAIYAIALDWPGRTLTLSVPKATPQTQVTLLGDAAPLHWREAGGRLTIELPEISPHTVAPELAYVFKLTGVE